MTVSASAPSAASSGNTTTTHWAPLIAGFSGGAISTITLYPLDLIKVRLQVNESSGLQRVSATRAFLALWKHEGMAGLYQGLTPAVMGSSISWGGYFFFYEKLKRQLAFTKRVSVSELTSVDNFTLACASGACMVALTNPVWLIKTRMQLQLSQTSKLMPVNAPYTGMMDAARTIVREEGIMSLYKGAGPALMLTSHGGVQFVAYEFLKKYFHYARPKREIGTHAMERFQLSIGYLTIGAMAKIIASTTTYPLQVIKSRLQQRSGKSLDLTSTGDLKVVRTEYVGFINTVRRIWVAEGINGFYKGCLTNAARVAPGAAITFLVYESVLDVFDYNVL